jgi:hypothetical protein
MHWKMAANAAAELLPSIACFKSPQAKTGLGDFISTSITGSGLQHPTKIVHTATPELWKELQADLLQ